MCNAEVLFLFPQCVRITFVFTIFQPAEKSNKKILFGQKVLGIGGSSHHTFLMLCLTMNLESLCGDIGHYSL